MRVFQYFPQSEKIDAFNGRLAKHCADENVVDVRANALKDGSLLITCTHEEDLAISPPGLIQPMVIPYNHRANVADLTNAFARQVEATSTDDAPRQPFGLLVAEREDGSGFAVVLVCVGISEEAEGAEGTNNGD